MTLHSLIKEVAKDYVIKYAAPVGVRVYSWESWSDSMDDTTAECFSDYALPADVDEYSWNEVKDCKITGIYIESCDELENEFNVKVSAEILSVEGYGENEDEEEIPEEPEVVDFYLEIVWDEAALDFIVVDCQV